MAAIPASEIVEALRAAGHAESTDIRMCTTGFHALPYGVRVIVTAVIGDDVEGHPDSPAHAEMRAQMALEYKTALEAAGWAVRYGGGGGLTVLRQKAA
jgi:hypothetical protein